MYFGFARLCHIRNTPPHFAVLYFYLTFDPQINVVENYLEMRINRIKPLGDVILESMQTVFH